MGTETIKPSDIKIKVASKTPDLIVRSGNPRFKYEFKEEDVPLDMPENHAEKVLRNNNFYIYKGVAKIKKDLQEKPKRAKSSKSKIDETTDDKKPKEGAIH